MTTRHFPTSRGITLIETTVTTAVVATVLGLVAPGLQDMQLRQRLDGVVAQLETDLMLTRSEAVMRNESLHVAFFQDPAGSCYIVHSGDKGDCTCTSSGASSCQPGAQVLRQSQQASVDGVRLQANSPSMLFDAVRGTVTPTATIAAQSKAGELRAIVNVMGRVRTCSTAPAIRSGQVAC